MPNFSEILHRQQAMFDTGLTKSISFRVYCLGKLRKWVEANSQAIITALKQDLNKPSFEAYATEINIVLGELKYAARHIHKWTRPKSVAANIINFPSRGRIYPEPYGVALIISPWNYPFMLAAQPLISAIAAGCCAVIKPSELAPATSALIARMCSELFHPSHVKVLEGGRETGQALLQLPFDKIFFTGSAGVGRLVMEAAAKNLVPVTLELGGKNPCIVDKSANIKLAAKRIIWGKLINAGQTCVAPDYVLVHTSVKDALLKEMKKAICKQYGPMPAQNPEYARIVNEEHFRRLVALMDGENIVHGGGHNLATLQIEPTLIYGGKFNASDLVVPIENRPIMKEEIFGPILPVLAYSSMAEAVRFIKSHPKPLALYVFTANKSMADYIIKHLSYGGGCINDTVMHLSVPGLPFGGVGESGMGSSHGKAGFDAFTHNKSVLHKPMHIDIPMSYPPYSKMAMGLLKLL